MRVRNSLLVLLCLICSSSYSQKLIDDITEIFEFEIKNKRRDSGHYVTKLVLAPIISFEPSTSLGFGVGSKLLFKPKNAGEETRTSNIPLAIQYTLNNQFIFFSSYDIFFPQEKYLLKGNLIYSKFPIGYFGVGNSTYEAGKVDISFNQLLIEPLLLKEVKKYYFLGGGIRMLSSYNAEVNEELELDPRPQLVDSINNFSMGFEFASTIDSRNNVLNATDGTFFEFTHGVYNKAIGSENNYMLTKANFRKYYKINPNKLNVFALELFTRLSWGEPPLLDLPTLGGPELLRGYQESRFRDRFAYFSQVEYRWQTFRRIGLVFFGGTGTVMGESERFELNDLKYTLGTGIRLKIVESENLNIRLDYAHGFGNENDRNFYLGIAEAF